MTDFELERKNISRRANEKQRLAADPKKSVWVEASAGTGKTKVLSDRVLRLLLDGVHPAKVLCLTYTKAAAVEMNSRIAGRLGRWAVLKENELIKELESLLGVEPSEELSATARRLFAQFLDTAGGMKIQTIHSFCQEVLKRFPLEAGISPYFEVMDERSTIEALDDIKKKLLRKSSPALAYLTGNVSEFIFPKLMKMITDKRNEIAELLAKIPLNDLVSRLSEKTGVHLDDKREDFVVDEAHRLKFLTTKGEPRAKLKPEEREEAERLVALDAKLAAWDLLHSTQAMLSLAADLVTMYKDYKKIHSKMDYDDLIVLTRNLLENKEAAAWVLYKLDGGIDHILIDEAQDTSPNQWAIVRAVSEELLAGTGVSVLARTVFAVGDRKQSIYSFQGADVWEFEKAKEHFSSKIEEFEKIDLDVSFRSVSAVLDVVNNLFQEGSPHLPFRAGDAGKVELWSIIEEEKEADVSEKVWKKPVERVSISSSSARLAKEIVSRIRQAVEGREALASKGRAVKYKDFLILVQRRNSFVDELIRECKNQNVSVAGADKIKLEEQIVVQDLVVLGKFLLMPLDDLSLATVLKSPLFGLDDDDLFALCHNRGHTPLWTILGQNKKYEAVYKVLQELQNMMDFVRPFELYSHVLNVLGGRKKFMERMGSEVEDGLDEFINLALNFENEHIPSLQKFIQWMSTGSVEIKRELEQSDVDAVRIMTVHGSKGLQAPIVILPDMVRMPMARREGDILFDGDLVYFPLSSAQYEENCNRIFESKCRMQTEEYRRLLYVALTRAEDRLCLCGYAKKSKPKEESWYEVCRRSFSEIGKVDETGKIVYEMPQSAIVKPEKKSVEAEGFKEMLPWVNRPAVKEGPLAKPLAPSKLYEEEEEPAVVSPLKSKQNNGYQRGLIIHKLLQFIPEIEASQQVKRIDDYLKNVSDAEVIKAKVLALLEKHSELFCENSRAEASIMGKVNGKIFSGQIDRLVVKEKEVWIVDYKTNRVPALNAKDVPMVYQKQLQAYKALMGKIYPDKSIRTYILWTNNLELMELNI